MVTVLPAVDRGPSFGERLNIGIGRGLGIGEQLLREHQQKEAIRQLVGEGAENLPPEFQKLILQSKITPEKKMTPLQEAQLKLTEERTKALQSEKKLTPLQETQQQLAEERIKALKGQQGLSQRIFGGGDQGEPSTGMGSPSESQQGQFDLKSIPDEKLKQGAAFAGQPGEMGILGNMFKGELERRTQERKTSPEFQREQQLTHAQAQADVKYNAQLQEASKQHELKKQTLDRLETLNKKGVTGKPYEKLLEKFGLVALTSEGRREFAADLKNLITDIRSILGAQFTGFEFQTILNAYPSPDFSKEANTAIIKNLKDFQDIKSKEVEIAQQLKKDNKGKIPEDFQAKVNEKVREYAQSKIPDIKENTRKIMNEEYGIKPGFTLMFDSQGEPLNVPDNEVIILLENGLAELP